MPTPLGRCHWPPQSGYFDSSCAEAFGVVAESAPVSASAAIDRVQNVMSVSDAAFAYGRIHRLWRKQEARRPAHADLSAPWAKRPCAVLTGAPPAVPARRSSASAPR